MTTRIAAVLLTLTTALAGAIAVAGPAGASSITIGAITNPAGRGVLYADDGGYCEPGVNYSSGQPVGGVSSCRGNPSPLRVEIYPVPLGANWDPFTSPAGGLAVEAGSGANVGNLALPSADSGGIKLTGKITSRVPVDDQRLQVNLFQLLDTSNGTGIPNGALTPGDGRNTDPNPKARTESIINHELKVTGVGGVPGQGVSAVLLNVTAIDPTADGFVTAYPKLPRGGVNPADPIRLFDDQSSFLPNYPNSSSLNFVAGDIVPNLLLARVGAGGKIRLQNFAGLTHAAADVVGWFDTGAKKGDGFTGISPTRLLDTRNGTGNIGGRLTSGDTRELRVTPSAS